MARRLALLTLLALLTMRTPAGAQTAARKAGRGLAAITTAFLEIPGNMVAEQRAQGAATGLPLGFVKGLGMSVVRELVGVYEFVSAPFPAPAGYRPLIQPEFPWGYFEGDQRSDLGRPRGRTTRARRRRSGFAHRAHT